MCKSFIPIYISINRVICVNIKGEIQAHTIWTVRLILRIIKTLCSTAFKYWLFSGTVLAFWWIHIYFLFLLTVQTIRQMINDRSNEITAITSIHHAQWRFSIIPQKPFPRDESMSTMTKWLECKRFYQELLFKYF